MANVARYSISRKRISEYRFERFVWAWEVYVPRWSSKYYNQSSSKDYQFTMPTDQFTSTLSILLELFKKLVHRRTTLTITKEIPHLNFREPSDGITNSPTTTKFLKHLSKRTTTPITIPKDQKTSRIFPQILMLRNRTDHIANIALRVISFRRTHMTNNLCPIQCDPIERLY